MGKQKDILYTMKKLVDGVRNTRAITGEDPKNHEEIWKEIGDLYDKLWRESQAIFDEWLQND